MVEFIPDMCDHRRPQAEASAREFAPAPVPTCLRGAYMPKPDSLPEMVAGFFLEPRNPGYRHAAENEARRKSCGCSIC
jgi:hypothetical protein